MLYSVEYKIDFGNNCITSVVIAIGLQYFVGKTKMNQDTPASFLLMGASKGTFP